MTQPTLDLLRALCAGLSPNRIRIEAHPSRTAFIPNERRIVIAERYLMASTPAALGALLHEVGHSFVTRYDKWPEPSGIKSILWREGLNAVEESRVHVFLRTRLPGTRPYLAALFAVDAVPKAEHFDSDLRAFLAAAAMWDRYPTLPFLPHFTAAENAFQSTKNVRERYTQLLPPPDLTFQPNLLQRFNTQVTPHIKVSETIGPVEAEILCAAAGAMQLFIKQIWPTIVRLASDDEGKIAWALAKDHSLLEIARVKKTSQLARQALRLAHEPGQTGQPARLPQVDKEHLVLARCLFEKYLADPKPAATRVMLSKAGSDSEEATSFDAPDREVLASVIRNALVRRPRQWTGGYRTGPLLDLDSVIRSVATGRMPERIWKRRTRERPRLAALSLIDLSGSMSGGKIGAAITATTALTAALSDIAGVRWAVLGFQDKVIPFVDFDERYDEATAARIATMRNEVEANRPGGNNLPRYNDDGPCLLEAASLLMEQKERDRLLLVISDGNPEGKRSTRDDLHGAVRTVQAIAGLTLVGLGIGPGTTHVKEYYPVSQADVPLDELANTLGQLLAATLNKSG